jgi:MraZ protein
VFLSTYEKQLDAKRRLLIPQDFRSAANGAEHGVFCFPSIEADCLEAGGDHLFNQYRQVIDDLPFGDPLRSALEVAVFGALKTLSFDAGGRITLTDALCERMGVDPAGGETVVIVGIGERFQIWNRERWLAHEAKARATAGAGFAQLGEMRRQAAIAAKASGQ